MSTTKHLLQTYWLATCLAGTVAGCNLDATQLGFLAVADGGKSDILNGNTPSGTGGDDGGASTVGPVGDARDGGASAGDMSASGAGGTAGHGGAGGSAGSHGGMGGNGPVGGVATDGGSADVKDGNGGATSTGGAHGGVGGMTGVGGAVGVAGAGGTAGNRGAGGAGGSSGIPCAKQGSGCDHGGYCEFPTGTCGSAGAMGVCAVKPEACDAVAAPVCGCDGKTYANDCTRQNSGVSKLVDGACQPGSGGSGN